MLYVEEPKHSIECSPSKLILALITKLPLEASFTA